MPEKMCAAMYGLPTCSSRPAGTSMSVSRRPSCFPISMYSRIVAAALGSMIGPMSLPGSIGSPMTSVLVDSTRRFRNRSYAVSTTTARLHAEHFWPQ